MKRNDLSPPDNTYKKKQKLADYNEIWGEDLAIEDVDRCINNATQMLSLQNEQTQNGDNSYFVPNYDQFRTKQESDPSIFSSTPLTIVRSSTSSVNSGQLSNGVQDVVPVLLKKIDGLELKNKKICEENETKRNEITFLRFQLKEAENALNKEKQAKEQILKENSQKIDETLRLQNKDKESLKCELQLKSLEVANLRVKIATYKKTLTVNNLNCTSVDEVSTQIVCNQIENDLKKCTNRVVFEPKNYYFPLKKIFPPHLFEQAQQHKFILKFKNISEKVAYYQHNFSTTPNYTPKNVNVEKNITTNYLNYSELLKFLNYTEIDLNNSPDVNEFICRLINIAKQDLLYLLNKLEDKNVENDHNDLKNILYLNTTEIHYNSDCVFSPVLWSENEVEIDIRRTIAVIFSLCIHNNLLHKYLIGEYYNYFDNNSLQHLTNNLKHDNFNFLKTLLQITTAIKTLYVSEEFCGFQAATLKLLSNLAHKQILSIECYKIIFEIFKQIIFAQPNQLLLKYISEFLKYISEHSLFVSQLCNKCSDYETQDGLFYFTDNCCLFRIILIELETCEFNTEIICNIMQFFRNVGTCNVPWMIYTDSSCGCLFQSYNLIISMLHKLVDEHSTRILRENNKEEICRFYTILRNGILYLPTLTVKIPDLIINKNTNLLSKYLRIVEYMEKNREKIHLRESHEIVIENLISQYKYEPLKYHELKDSNDTNTAAYYYHCNFNTF